MRKAVGRWGGGLKPPRRQGLGLLPQISTALGTSPGRFLDQNFTRKRMSPGRGIWAEMAPPWRWTMPWAMDSPTPKPLP